MIDVKISGAFTYKIDRYSETNTILIYEWNSDTGNWELKTTITGDCNITLEMSRGEDKQSCQD